VKGAQHVQRHVERAEHDGLLTTGDAPLDELKRAVGLGDGALAEWRPSSAEATADKPTAGGGEAAAVAGLPELITIRIFYFCWMWVKVSSEGCQVLRCGPPRKPLTMAQPQEKLSS
jgi:hypothetical protein